jgi:hypothetical protein
MSTASDALSWSYEGENARLGRKEKYTLYPNNGVVAFQNGMARSTPESIARQMLDGLLG